MSAERPDVFRAVACIEPSRWWWITTTRRVLHYDAYWDDGRIEHDVNLVEYMYRRAPADFSMVRKAIDDVCPPVGTGEWVEYPYGNVLRTRRSAPSDADRVRPTSGSTCVAGRGRLSRPCTAVNARRDSKSVRGSRRAAVQRRKGNACSSAHSEDPAPPCPSRLSAR